MTEETKNAENEEKYSGIFHTKVDIKEKEEKQAPFKKMNSVAAHAIMFSYLDR